MTKPANPEEILKTPLGLEDPKIDTCVTSLLEKNTIVVSKTRVDLPEENVANIPLPKSRRILKKNKLAKVTERLYDLEPYGSPEKSLNIDLDLYQMEDH